VQPEQAAAQKVGPVFFAKRRKNFRSRRVKNAALLTDDQPRPRGELQAGTKEQAF
jgi:hypothetical protein